MLDLIKHIADNKIKRFELNEVAEKQNNTRINIVKRDKDAGRTTSCPPAGKRQQTHFLASFWPFFTLLGPLCAHFEQVRGPTCFQTYYLHQHAIVTHLGRTTGSPPAGKRQKTHFLASFWPFFKLLGPLCAHFEQVRGPTCLQTYYLHWHAIVTHLGRTTSSPPAGKRQKINSFTPLLLQIANNSKSFQLNEK